MTEKRNPRIDPRAGDVLDDDPPNPPLLVHRSGRPGVVYAARYAHVGDTPCECDGPSPGHYNGCGCNTCARFASLHPSACACPGCAEVESWTWPIEEWRREMRGAPVRNVASTTNHPRDVLRSEP